MMLPRSLFARLTGTGTRFRRDSFVIISDILLLATSGMKKTELMCKAGLSSEQVQKYLPMLFRSELLQISREKRRIVYKTTEKGKDLLQTLEELAKLLD
jgi:predicted transcriptional regulator